MSDDETTPKRGRSLRPKGGEATFDDLDADAAGQELSAEVMASAMAATPDPLDDTAHRRKPGQQQIKTRHPSGLVWNHGDGIRLAPYHEASKDDGGSVRVDGAGHPIWAVVHTEKLYPGLNLVSVEWWGKLLPNLKRRIEIGEIQSLGDQPSGIPEHRMIKAISETGEDAPLLWLLDRERRHSVIDALEQQRQHIATGGETRAVG